MRRDWGEVSSGERTLVGLYGERNVQTWFKSLCLIYYMWGNLHTVHVSQFFVCVCAENRATLKIGKPWLMT